VRQSRRPLSIGSGATRIEKETEGQAACVDSIAQLKATPWQDLPDGLAARLRPWSCVMAVAANCHRGHHDQHSLTLRAFNVLRKTPLVLRPNRGPAGGRVRSQLCPVQATDLHVRGEIRRGWCSRDKSLHRHYTCGLPRWRSYPGLVRLQRWLNPLVEEPHGSS
jgi:hypothetical protein